MNKIYKKIMGILLLPKLISQYGGVFSSTKILLKSIKKQGVKRSFYDCKSIDFRSINEKNTSDISSQNLITPLEVRPLITVIIPCCDMTTKYEYLEESIISVTEQTYERWQLIVVCDESISHKAKQIIDNYADKNVKIVPICCTKYEESDAINLGLDVACGEFYFILNYDDVLSPNALYWVVERIGTQPNLDYLYSDEDKLSKDGKYTYSPFYKPSWSPEYLLAMNYTGNMSVFRTSLIKKIKGYRNIYEGAHKYDLILRVSRETKNISHIAKLLYHKRIWRKSTFTPPHHLLEKQVQAVNNHLTISGQPFTISNQGHALVKGEVINFQKINFLPTNNSLISIVIPTANSSIKIDGSESHYIDELISSIIEKSTYLNYEVLILHDGNLTNNQIERFNKLGQVRLVLHKVEKTFSFSNKVNHGCKVAKGEYLLILNDDMAVISADWLQRMLGAAQKEGVGVVGAKLLFSNYRIQHAGVIIRNNVPRHPYYNELEDIDGYALGAKVNRNYIAITGACQLVSKELFFEVGGYNPDYPLNFNDIDFCLRLHKIGYRHISLADVRLFHYEGASKDKRRTVSQTELKRFLTNWKEAVPKDPYYNANIKRC